MSRRKLHWRDEFRRSGNVLDRILPTDIARGTGKWLATKESNKKAESSVGKIVTQPISQRKESIIRKWTAK